MQVVKAGNKIIPAAVSIAMLLVFLRKLCYNVVGGAKCNRWF